MFIFLLTLVLCLFVLFGLTSFGIGFVVFSNTLLKRLLLACPQLAQELFVCPISNCKRTFGDQKKLSEHMFVCWGNQFTSTFSLPRKPKYGCNHDGCKMAFQTKDEYSLHLKFQHSDNNPLPVQLSKWFCPSCEVSFSNRKEHAYHLSVCAVNKGARQIEENSKRLEQTFLYCPSCNHPFADEESLTRHVYHCWGIKD